LPIVPNAAMLRRAQNAVQASTWPLEIVPVNDLFIMF